MSGPKGESGIKGNKNEKRGKPLAFIRDLIDRYYAHDVARDGAALTYYLLFAIFPLLVFVSTLVGLMDLDIEETLTAMSRILPEQVLGIVGSYLEYVSTSPSRQLLVFSLIFSVWFPLRATSCLMHSVRKAYGVPQPPSMIGGTLRNLIFTLWLIVTIAASIVLTTVGRRALYFVSGIITVPDGFINLWSKLRFVAVALLMFVLVTVLYMLALGRRCPLREVAPGVAVSLAAWMLLSLAFSYYVENLAHYTQLYGSIATIVVVLLWLYMSGTVLILGGELNAVVLHRRTQRRRAAEEKAAEKAARPTRQEAAAQKPSGSTQPPRQPQPPKSAEQPEKADPPKPAEPPKQTQGQPPQEAIPPEKEQPERPGKEQSGS